MSIFIKKKKGNLEEQGFRNKPVSRFAETIEKKKMKASAWLGKKIERYSFGRKKTGLIIFCIFFGGLSFYQLASSLGSHSFNSRSLVITHLRSGVHEPPISPIADSVIHKVEKIRLWIDSLLSHDTIKLKAILLARPFLLENIQNLEKLYQYQTK
ncbi:MAG TPA: hypothetical protein VK772_13460 [Puia sp.]|jgi:hypothetical protein|nr:hypothetical protein [Puia sp.]